MESVAQHLGSGREIAAAVNALQFFGRAVPGIEPHLMSLMKNKNSTVRVETSRLLAAFGTGKSLPALMLAAKDTDAAVAKAASAALEVIRKRTRPK
jgi:HEAT repeat protein